MADDDRSGFDRLGERTERYADRQAGRFAERPKRTALRWLFGIIAVVAIVTVIGGVTGLLFDWGGETKRLVGPDHSREQVTRVLDLWEKMPVAAANACGAIDAARSGASPTFVEDPALAYKARYRTMAADYNRMMGNFFEAALTRRLPIPDGLGGLPRRAPTLVSAMAAAGCSPQAPATP